VSTKADDHRRRVLDNLTRAARDAERPQSDPQLRIPLLVEVKASADEKQPVRRKRAKGVQRQPQLGKL
jgi:hypothetical protein